jgi:2-dehydro-3-deoxyphosphogluconate aldolase/(4S)-4-hydroxy-2-oxoglutarate aldolase
MNVQQSMITEALRRWRIIPVITIDDVKNAVPLTNALLSGGLPIAEITLRTPVAMEALRRITREQPEMFAGVGTVLNVRQAALEAGLGLLKLWPIQTLGGIEYLKFLSGPFAGVEFNPSGGVTAANFESYLGLKNVVACGGSWMAPPEWIAAKQFERIRSAVRDTVMRSATFPAKKSQFEQARATHHAAPPR